MARDYGNERSSNIVFRVSEQEKEQIKAAAANFGKSISDFLRDAVAAFMSKEAQL